MRGSRASRRDRNLKRRAFGALALAALLAACAARAEAPGTVVVAVDGDKPPSAQIAAELAPYFAFRTHEMAAWHPAMREVHARRRSTEGVELVRVPEPGAAPLPLEALPGPAAARAFVPANESLGEGAWNAAGDRFAFTTIAGGEGGRRSTTLRLLDTTRADGVRVLGRWHAGEWTDLAFSPDGRRIALVERAGRRTSVWVIAAAGRERRRVSRPSQTPVRYARPHFTPDGRALVLASDRGAPFPQLARLELASGRERPLEARRAVVDLAVSHDSALAAFTTPDGEGGHVLRFFDLAAGKELPRPPLFSGIVAGLAWRTGSSELGFHVQSARTAGDVFSYDPLANRLQRWTNGNSRGVNVREFAEPRAAHWRDPAGLERLLLAYHPPERHAGKRPVVVSLAGDGGARPEFIGAENYLVNELGIAVIRPDIGSADFPQALEALAAWIEAQPALDAKRMLLLDRAPGGDRARAVVARAPARFRAVVFPAAGAGEDYLLAAVVASAREALFEP